MPASIQLVDFHAPGAADAWQVVNDGVMGGISTGDFKMHAGVGVFSGCLLADNSGGFASVRTAISSENASNIKSIVIRVRGDGKRYQCRLRTSERSDLPGYKYSFATSAGQWQEVSMAIADFQATFRGRPVPDAPALESQRIWSIGFLIAEKQFGAFRLEVESMLALR